MGADQFIRPFSDGDRDALADICLRTGASGGDATGMYRSERFLADVFVLPYVERHPDLAWVVDDGDGNAIGYIVGADDTDAFEGWFRDEWWPTRRPAYADAVGDRELWLLGYADGRRPGAEALAAEHPAHLHIDLLPEAQGSGWGRRLIDTLVAAMADRGVTGVHLVASGDNAGAIAFYPRVGFTRAASAEDVAAFTRTL